MDRAVALKGEANTISHMKSAWQFFNLRRLSIIGTLRPADDMELLAIGLSRHQGKPNFFRAAVPFSNPVRHGAGGQT